MKTPTGSTTKNRLRLILYLAVIFVIVENAYAQTTAFTYQGKLADSGNPANAAYDMQFKLFDALVNGTQIGSTLTFDGNSGNPPSVSVTNGIFTVNLDFGSAALSGADRYLEIGLKPAGNPGGYQQLLPRQKLTSTPYAVQALNATNAAQLGGLAASGFLQNSTSQQAGSNFNISGNGTAGGTLTGSIVNAVTQVNINGLRSFTVNGVFNDGAGTVFTASNTFAGDGAGVNTTPSGTLNDGAGKFNSFYGAGAGQANTTGSENAFFGSTSGQANNTGAHNAFFGAFAGFSNNTGVQNAFFGYVAGYANTTGNDNAFFGTFAGAANAAGQRNTFIGDSADFNTTNTTGNDNTLLGSSTRVTANLSNATAIGAHASATQSNTLILGGVTGVNFGTSVNVGIGTTAPRSALEVVRNWDGSFGALTVTGDRPTIRFSGGAPANNDQWILHLGSMAGTAPAGSLSFFFGGTAGTSYGNPVLSLTPSGTVIIGNLGTAGPIPLCLNGSSIISNCSSSLRYKSNVAAYLGGLDIVNRLRPIAFTWKQDGKRDIGFGAEEVEQVEPLLTFRNEKGEVEGVKYNQLSAVFINAFKEQQAQLREHEHQAAQQQQQLEQYRQQLIVQQREMESLKRLVCLSHPGAAICKMRRRR